MEILKKINYIYIILFLFAVIMSFQCCFSPINTSGYISNDVAVWTNIAKKMEQGQIMYKDFFDHKGPCLYFIYYVGHVLGGTLGIWFIDFLCNIINVMMIYKISEVFLKNKWKSLIVVSVCMMFLCNINVENPCTESLSVPFILIALYQFIKFIINEENFNFKESVITGLCFAVVFFLKPNLASIWLVYYLYIFIKMIKEKKVKKLIKIIMYSLVGFLIISIPIILFLIINNAFEDFVNSYFLFNFKYAKNKEHSIIKILKHFATCTNYVIIYICIIYFILAIIKENLTKAEKKLLLLSKIHFVIEVYLAIMPQRAYTHYYITTVTTIIIPLAIFLKQFKVNKIVNGLIVCTLLLIVAVSTYKVNLLYISFLKYTQNLKYISKQVQEATDKDDNVLVLGKHTAIYLMSDRQYKGKYFYQNPIANQDKKIGKEIIEVINKDFPKLIIFFESEWLAGGKITEFEKNIQQILAEEYITNDKKIYIKK